MVSDENLIEQHRRDKIDSIRFKERRTNQWNENYFLFRDKVQTNRLTQRQPVNIPVIRDTIQNWISKIDEAPQLSFETRGKGLHDKRGEIAVNEMWGFTYDDQKLDLKDNLDKKIVGLQGRSFKYWYWMDGKVKCDVVDPYDIDIDPRVNPFDLNTSAYLNHKNIFVPLRRILANKSYSADGKNLLKLYLESRFGLIRSRETDVEYQQKLDRLRELGASNYDDYASGDVMVELTRSYKMMWDESTQKLVRYLVVFAMDSVVLYKQPIKKALGIDFLPWTSWASDPDLNDMWSDGVADSVRTINKVINMYFSQDLENRTYRNFGMYFFDTKNGTFQPQAFEAKPFGMYGVDGNPDEVMKQIKIEPLSDTFNAIEYLKNLVQSSVAQTPTERGEQTKSRTTLGEIQLTAQSSKSRNQVVAKQYQSSWEESGRIWYELIKNNTFGQITLSKRGPDGEVYKKTFSKSDWATPDGYDCKVILQSEKEANDDVDFKKIQYIKQSYQNNPVAQKIAKRKELELLGWDPDEIDSVMQAEEAAPVPTNPIGPDGKPVPPATDANGQPVDSTQSAPAPQGTITVPQPTGA